MALGLIGKEKDIELNLEENMLTKKFLLGQITSQTWFQLGDNIINIFKLQQQLREGGIIYRGYDTGIWHRKHREIIETVLNDFKKALKQIINIKEGTP